MTIFITAILAVSTIVFIGYPFLKKWLGSVNPVENDQLQTDSDMDAEIEKQVLELRKPKGHR